MGKMLTHRRGRLNKQKAGTSGSVTPPNPSHTHLGRVGEGDSIIETYYNKGHKIDKYTKYGSRNYNKNISRTQSLPANGAGMKTNNFLSTRWTFGGLLVVSRSSPKFKV